MWIGPRAATRSWGGEHLLPAPAVTQDLPQPCGLSNDVAIDHGPFEVNAYAGTMPEAEIADFAAEVAKYG